MDEKQIFIKILKIAVFISGVVLFGSFGYAELEGLAFADALYMTVITLTTTGYGDIVPKTEWGRHYTIYLLSVGMGVVTYSATTVVNYIINIDFSKRRREKMETKVGQLKDHTIVCGFGRMGEIICKKLQSEGVTFVVIEKDENLIQQLKNSSYLYVEGDAAHDEILEKVAVKNAGVLVSVIDNDADGLYITLAARSYNPKMQIIVRANEPSARKRMIRAGANKVILPYVMSGLKVAESVINPAVEDFLSLGELDSNGEGDIFQLADLYVTDQSSIIEKTIRQIGPALDKLIIVGIRKPDQSFLFSPRGDYIFQRGDCLIVLGDQDAYKKTKKQFGLISQLKPPVIHPEAAA